jgi:hypothetical protein
VTGRKRQMPEGEKIEKKNGFTSISLKEAKRV